MKRILAAILAVSFLGLHAQDRESASRPLPATALLRGVPFVSWSDAAQLRYEQKQLVNPSLVAVGRMLRGYWGQDGGFRLFRIGPEPFLPEHWNGAAAPETAKGLADLKAWIAQGVPVAVALPLTPHAHPIAGAAGFLVGAGQIKLPAPGPSAGGLGRWASWETLVDAARSAGSDSNRHFIIREVVTMAYRLVIGYDDARQVVVLHDPSFGPAIEMSYDLFEANWRLNDFHHIARPPAEYAEFVAKRTRADPYAPRTPDMLAASRFTAGYALSQTGRAADAERELEQGLAIAGVGNGYRWLLLHELAAHRAAAGRLEEAVSLLRQAIDALPEAPGPWERLGALYRANPGLPGAPKEPQELEQTWKSRHANRASLGVYLRTVPRDFAIQGLMRLRGWACEADFRGSGC